MGVYLYAIVKNHPNKIKRGYVLLHRIIMENHINRLLTKDEVVHHKNHNKRDNNIDNLEVLSKAEHARLHAIEHGRQWCDLKCPNCGIIFDRQVKHTFLQTKSKYTCCSRTCKGKFATNIQYGKITIEKYNELIEENLIKRYIKYI